MTNKKPAKKRVFYFCFLGLRFQILHILDVVFFRALDLKRRKMRKLLKRGGVMPKKTRRQKAGAP